MSKFQPTVVIGIGGTGKNILLSLKKMIVENSPNGMADFPVLKLFSVDTDNRVGTVKTELKTITEDLGLDPNTEMFRLGGDGITREPDLEAFPAIDGWFPASKRYMLNPSSLSAGASQMKPVGRFSFAWNEEALERQIYKLFGDIVDPAKAKMYGIGEKNLSDFTNVFICGSLAGGTGSGIFLDMAYLVRSVAAQRNMVVEIYGMLALASIFDSISGDIKLKPNCYASLVELDHFMNRDNFKNGKRNFFAAYRNKDKDLGTAANNSPFDYPYIFDKTNEGGLALGSQKDFSEMVARFVYLLTGSAVSVSGRGGGTDSCDVAGRWQSISNNIKNAVDTNDIQKGKPIIYRSMGAFALVYPRRRITQACAYKLASDYLRIILDTSYQQTPEIDNLVERFLNDSRTNPDNGLLEEEFDLFRSSADEAAASSFLGHVSETADYKVSECESADKKDLEDIVRRFKEDMDSELAKFRAQNSSRAKAVRDAFVRALDRRMAAFVDLNLAEDTANPFPDGGKRMVRGSLARARDFLTALRRKFTDAEEKYRKAEETSREQARSLEDEYEIRMDELREAVNSFIPGKAKIRERVEGAIQACSRCVMARQNNLVSAWIRQLLNEITENNMHIADGILKAIDEKCLNVKNGVGKLKRIQAEVEEYIYKSRGGASMDFCEVIFDYRTDVEEMFGKVMADSGENLIYENLSKALKSPEGYGEAYEKLGASLPEPRILAVLLRNAEEPFFGPVSEVDISDRVLERADILENLKSGTYTSNAKVYVRLTDEMSKAGLPSRGTEVFCVTIPNEVEYDKNCKELIKRDTGVNHVCPFEPGGEMANAEERCPREGKCLKAMILRGAGTDLEIIPSDNKSEINIFKTTAGFPLRAVATVSGPYREAYAKQVERDRAENEKNGVGNEESLHMFGPVKFSDLDAQSVNLSAVKEAFKRKLLLAYALERLSIERLSVKFLSQRALVAGRKDFDCELGGSFGEAAELSLSIRLGDIGKVREVEAGVAYELGLFRTPEEMDELYRLLKVAYDRLVEERPADMGYDDVEIIDKLSVELCGRRVYTPDFDPTKNRHMEGKKAAAAAAAQSAEPCPPPPPADGTGVVPPPVVEMQHSYSLSVGGKSYGPYPVDTLRGYIATGQFAPQSMVWMAGMKDWTPAENVPELAALFAPPPVTDAPPAPPAPPPLA